MKKKWIALILAALLAISSLAACSTASPSGSIANAGAGGNLDPQNPVTVTLWHYYVGENQQALEAAVSDFNQTLGIEEGVIVEAVAMGSIAELETAITDSAMGIINSQPMPQVFSSYPDKALEIDALDQVVDLNEYFTEAEKALYVDDFLADGIFEDGKMLLTPVVKSTELLYVNATAWNEFAEEKGYSEMDLASWETIYSTARAYYEWTDAQTPDTPWDGISLLGFDSVANFIIIGNKQLGVDIIDADGGESGQAVLDEEVLRRVFDIYYRGIALGYFGAVGKFRSDDIKAGNLISYVGSSSSAAYFPTWIESDNTQQPIEFLPLAYPVFEGGEPYAIQQGAGMCIAKSTPAQQEGAALFLKWFTAGAQNINFAMTTGYLPVEKEAYNSTALDEVLQGLREGDEAQQNVAGVYEIAFNQITESSTYAAKPFEGSYDVRSVLQSTLTDLAAADAASAAVYKVEGATEEEVLAGLDVDARFAQWLDTVRAELDKLDIEYSS